MNEQERFYTGLNNTLRTLNGWTICFVGTWVFIFAILAVGALADLVIPGARVPVFVFGLLYFFCPPLQRWVNGKLTR